MKLIGRHFPGLVNSVERELTGEGAEEAVPQGKPNQAPDSGPRGLFIYIEPDTTWKIQPGSPWARMDPTPGQLAGIAQMASLGGMPLEAELVATDAKRHAYQAKKRKPVLFRRLYAKTTLHDQEELLAGHPHYDGFLVPASPTPDRPGDMAASWERTRRRILRLIEKSIESGWTKSPLIALESPSPAFSERVTRDFVDVLIPSDAPRNAEFNAPQIAVPVQKGEIPWWITSENYLYCLRSNELWYDDWMINPLDVEGWIGVKNRVGG